MALEHIWSLAIADSTAALIEELGLPPAYAAAHKAIIEPLATRIASRVASQTAPPVIGIVGSQGSGKSTICRFLAAHLDNAVTLALDDYYLGRAERAQLAKTIHPLLATRGVPGTHDVAAGMADIEALQQTQLPAPVPLRRFSKSTDDVEPKSSWPSRSSAPSCIFFEGWCVGCPPLPEAALATPINDLEATEDADGRWRRFVADALKGDYARWFGMIDVLVFLQIPAFEKVFEWRWQQECELAAQNPDAPRLMDQPSLKRFIDHYERMTRYMLDVLPGRADVTIALGNDHAMTGIRFRSDGALA